MVSHKPNDLGELKSMLQQYLPQLLCFTSASELMKKAQIVAPAQLTEILPVAISDSECQSSWSQSGQGQSVHSIFLAMLIDPSRRSGDPIRASKNLLWGI